MRWVWTGWLIAILVSFAIFEGYALSRPDGLSLSQYVWDASQAWPPLPFILGLIIGILVSHFWWHWLPAQKKGKSQ